MREQSYLIYPSGDKTISDDMRGGGNSYELLPTGELIINKDIIYR